MEKKFRCCRPNPAQWPHHVGPASVELVLLARPTCQTASLARLGGARLAHSHTVTMASVSVVVRAVGSTARARGVRGDGIGQREWVGGSLRLRDTGERGRRRARRRVLMTTASSGGRRWLRHVLQLQDEERVREGRPNLTRNHVGVALTEDGSGGGDLAQNQRWWRCSGH
jgi:hypothetical protein